MKLPVIAVCGYCTFCGNETGGAYACEHKRGVGHVDPTLPPPAWCPLRTHDSGAADHRLEAFGRWADAARASFAAGRAFYASGRTSSDCVAMSAAEIHEAEAFEALRTAVVGGP